MNKEAYNLGVQLALQDCGLVKEAEAGLGTFKGFLLNALRRFRWRSPPVALAGVGSVGGGVVGLARSDEGDRLEGLLRGAGVGALTGGGAGLAGRLGWGPTLYALHALRLHARVPHVYESVLHGLQAAGGLAGLGVGLNTLTDGSRD